MPQTVVKDAASQAHHVGASVWVPERAPGEGPNAKRKAARWVKGKVVFVGQNKASERILEVQTEDGGTAQYYPAECPLQNERDDTVDDLVKSDFLHEPGYALPMASNGSMSDLIHPQAACASQLTTHALSTTFLYMTHLMTKADLHPIERLHDCFRDLCMRAGFYKRCACDMRWT